LPLEGRRSRPHRWHDRWHRFRGALGHKLGGKIADRLRLSLCLRHVDRACGHRHLLHVRWGSSAMNVASAPLLSIVTFLPLVGAAFIAGLSRDAVQNIRFAALWTTLITFAVSLLI